jgi:peptide/nickel transport system substrate-binding protein
MEHGRLNLLLIVTAFLAILLVTGGSAPVHAVHDDLASSAAWRGPWVDRIEISTVSSLDEALDMLEDDTLDIYTGTSYDSALYGRVQSSTEVVAHVATYRFDELTLNPAGPVSNNGKLNPFAVPEIREALNWLVDRERIVREILGGPGLAQYVVITPGFPEHARYRETVEALEAHYAYDFDQANAVIAAEMASLGATNVGGKWHYGDEPVTLIFLIRVEDERQQIGDYVADQLEAVGFTVDRLYRTANEAVQLSWYSDPAEGLWHLCTGGWEHSFIEREAGGSFQYFYTPRGLPSPLWEGYDPDPEFDEVARRLADRDFSSMEERRELFTRALELSMLDSARIWLVAPSPFSPRRAETVVAYNRAFSLPGSDVWPYSVRFVCEEGGTLRLAQPWNLAYAWNPVAGGSDVYRPIEDYDWTSQRATEDGAVVEDPDNGLMRPQRLERANVYVQAGLPMTKTLDWMTLTVSPTIEVPSDAWVDWDAVDQRFVTAGEAFTETQTARVKVVMRYEEDFPENTSWHDGSPFDVADMVMGMIMQFDRAKLASAIFDEDHVGHLNGFMVAFRGWRIASQDPIIVEYYSDNYTLDAENNVTDLRAAFPSRGGLYDRGTGAWHNIALGYLAEADEQLAFSEGKAGSLGVPWMDFISGPSLAALAAKLDEAQSTNFIPYANTLGNYVTAAQATQRWANLQAWYADRGHFWLGTGPFYLDEADPAAGTLSLQRYPGFPAPEGGMAVVLETESSVANALTGLESGELDISAEAVSDSDAVEQVEASPDLEAYRSYGSTNELTFNPSGPEFADGRLNPFSVPRIREAMNYLVDRAHIAEAIMGGMAIPRFVPINYASKDTAVLADVIAAIELQYTHDKERAAEIVTEEMENLGAEMVDGAWTYKGEPVEIIGLIRTEDELTEIGDYLADQLEDLGFTVRRDYKTGGEASSCWLGTDPQEGCFSYYTGRWNSTAISRDEGGNFLFFYTPDGYPGAPLWDSYTPTAAFYQLARDLASSSFSTMEARRDMMAQALDLAMEDSARVWLVHQTGITPRRAEVSYASDLVGGIAGSRLWGQTLGRGGCPDRPVGIALPTMLADPWNPIGGSRWVYDKMAMQATQHGAVVPDPFTGVMRPMRLESAEVFIKQGLPVESNLDWATLAFVEQITVPDDAWADWDPENQVFITAGEKYTETQTVNSKVVMQYEDDFFDRVTWHDGSPFTIADCVMFMIMQFDRAKEGSAIYDEGYVGAFDAFMEAFRGWRVLSQDPLVIEYYTNDTTLDAENNVTNFRAANPTGYARGEAPWHTVALGWHAEANGEAAFSSGKAAGLEVAWMSYVSGPTLDILEATLDEASVESFVPYSPTLGQYITGTHVTERLANLRQWYGEHGHFWVGTGPLYLEDVSAGVGQLTLKPYSAYPDPVDRWQEFATDPPIAEVSVEGPTSVELGEDAVYSVEVTLDGEPYPIADIDAVRYVVLNSQSEVQFTGEANPVVATSDVPSPIKALAATESQWRVVLDADMIGQLPPGPTRLEIIVTSKRVVIPSQASQVFTAPDAPVEPEADLSVSKQDSDDPVVAGKLLTYTVKVENAGPDTAENVEMTDTLPSGMELVGAEATQGACTGTVCELGTLPAGATAVVTLTVTAPSSAGVYTNTVQVGCETLDPDMADNEAYESLQVQAHILYLPVVLRGR